MRWRKRGKHFVRYRWFRKSSTRASSLIDKLMMFFACLFFSLFPLTSTAAFHEWWSQTERCLERRTSSSLTANGLFWWNSHLSYKSPWKGHFSPPNIFSKYLQKKQKRQTRVTGETDSLKEDAVLSCSLKIVLLFSFLFVYFISAPDESSTYSFSFPLSCILLKNVFATETFLGCISSVYQFLSLWHWKCCCWYLFLFFIDYSSFYLRSFCDTIWCLLVSPVNSFSWLQRWWDVCASLWTSSQDVVQAPPETRSVKREEEEKI